MKYLSMVLLVSAFAVSSASSQPLDWTTAYLGRTKIDRGTIDASRIVQVRSFLIFPGSYEPVKDYGRMKWYDLVAFNCVTSEYKVIFATESETC